ncbi:lymphocyte transmembrane adapter 1 [Ctenodactylus gundi]
MPSLTLPRPRQRAKNIYDCLPRRQEELGRHQSSSVHIVSTESLLSQISDSPEHVPSQTDDILQTHRAHIHAADYAIGVYDNATVPQVCGSLMLSTHYVNISASRDGSSISSEESDDYVNVPAIEEIDERLILTNSWSENPSILASTQELEFSEGGHGSCGDVSNGTSFGFSRTEDYESLSDGEDSSQTSNDYVNMMGLGLRDIQENQPWVNFQSCRDYENVPAADPNGSQKQTEEELTSSDTDDGEGRTGSPGTCIQSVPRRSISSGYYVAFQPCTQTENSQMTHQEELSSEDSNDYENVVAAELGGRYLEPGANTQLLPDPLPPTCPAGKPWVALDPAGFLASAEPHEDP